MHLISLIGIILTVSLRITAAQTDGYGNGGSDGGSDGGASGDLSSYFPVVLTCPVPEPTTVFITVTPVAQPSMVTVTVPFPASSPQSFSSNSQSSVPVNSSESVGIPWSPSRTVTIPCSTTSYSTNQVSNVPPAVPLTTDYVTMTIPPTFGQTTGKIITYTIITPLGPPGGPFGISSFSPSGISGNSLPTLTVTSLNSPSESGIPGGPGGQGFSTTPFTEPYNTPSGGYGAQGQGSGGTNLPPTITLTMPMSSTRRITISRSLSNSADASPDSSGSPEGQGTPSTVVTIPTSESLPAGGYGGNTQSSLDFSIPAITIGISSSASNDGSPGGNDENSTMQIITIPEGTASGGYGEGNGGNPGSSTFVTTATIPHFPSGSGSIGGAGTLAGERTFSSNPWGTITQVSTISAPSIRTIDISKSWTPIVTGPSGEKSTSWSDIFSETPTFPDATSPEQTFTSSPEDTTMPPITESKPCSGSHTRTQASGAAPAGAETTSMTRFSQSAVPSTGWNATTSTSSLGTNAFPTGGSTAIFTSSCTALTAVSESVLWPPPCSVPITCSSGLCTIISSSTSSNVSVRSSVLPPVNLTASRDLVSPTPTSNQPLTSILPATTLLSCSRVSSTIISNSTISWCVSSGTSTTIDIPTTPTPNSLPHLGLESSALAATASASTTFSSGYSWGNNGLSKCGNPADNGNFSFNMDDLPALAVEDSNSSDVHPMPMFSPYHRFWFSAGFNIVPPPKERFFPSSGKLMLQYIPSSLSNATMPIMPTGLATISVGAQQTAACFSFNLYGMNLGCDSYSSDCVFTFTGRKFDIMSKKNRDVLSQTIHVSACTQLDGCRLHHATVVGFTDLTSILVTLKVDNEDHIWWVDDLELGWYDNDCAMSICRSKVRDSILAKSDGKRWEA